MDHTCELIWSGSDKTKIYFDGQKFYFVKDPEGVALLFFVCLLLWPFVMSGFDYGLNKIELKDVFPNLSIEASFVVCGLFFLNMWRLLIKRPAQLPGDERKNFICFDIKSGLFEIKKKDGSFEYLASTKEAVLEFPWSTQQRLDTHSVTFTVFLTTQQIKIPIAGHFATQPLIDLLTKFSEYNLKIKTDVPGFISAKAIE